MIRGKFGNFRKISENFGKYKELVEEHPNQPTRGRGHEGVWKAGNQKEIRVSWPQGGEGDGGEQTSPKARKGEKVRHPPCVHGVQCRQNAK